MVISLQERFTAEHSLDYGLALFDCQMLDLVVIYWNILVQLFLSMAFWNTITTELISVLAALSYGDQLYSKSIAVTVQVLLILQT